MIVGRSVHQTGGFVKLVAVTFVFSVKTDSPHSCVWGIRFFSDGPALKMSNDYRLGAQRAFVLQHKFHEYLADMDACASSGLVCLSAGHKCPAGLKASKQTAFTNNKLFHYNFPPCLVCGPKTTVVKGPKERFDGEIIKQKF